VTPGTQCWCCFHCCSPGICQGGLDEIRDHLPDYANDDTAPLAIAVGPTPTHKICGTEIAELKRPGEG
jgi:hypothetical protein